MLDYFELNGSQLKFDQPIAEQIWRSKYQYKNIGADIDQTVGDTWLRVATHLAEAETNADRDIATFDFYEAMDGFKLLPAGRILAGSGTGRDVTLSNTFVMGTIEDSVEGVMKAAQDAALTMKMGGGLGFDFSTLRPKGTRVAGLDCPAAGSVAAMDICDAVCKMLVTGAGRGAMMGTMRCDHPDIEDFIMAKSDPARLRNFNLSVMITDPFMAAVNADQPWDLVWNDAVVRTVQARELWDLIMRQAYDAAEPGVLFIDRINAKNPLNYLETIAATNSCAEQPLPPNGTCPLASVNLSRLIQRPFEDDAEMNMEDLRRMVGVAVRMLDNVVDLSKFAVDAQRAEAQAKRRIGIGVTGVADALIMVGQRYGSAEAVRTVSHWMRAIQNAAYLASANLAAERGAFPAYDADQHLGSAAIAALDPEVRATIQKHGLRNGTLTTIAPTGTISMLAGNVSSGIEPIFAMSYTRIITRPDGTKGEDRVEAYAALKFRELFGKNAPLSEAFVTAQDLKPDDHVRMQAAAQQWIDTGISKTVNCPEEITFDAFRDVYAKAYESGCKGCTTYRPNAITGSVLSV